MTFEEIASSLRADERDIEGLIETLALKLEGDLGRYARVNRKESFSGGRFRRKKTVEIRGVEVTLPKTRYSIGYTDTGKFWITRTPLSGSYDGVRSIPVTIAYWLSSLKEELRDLAEDAEQGRIALDDYLSGPAALTA
jgi:hypothetical protein